MAFQILLDQIGGLGRFQILHTIVLLTICIMVNPRVMLENFTAVVPSHRCWVHVLDNETVSGNDSEILSKEALLRISIPLDSNLRPEKCRRFIHPQWQLLHLNETFSNTVKPDTEPCMDGWVYNQSSFLSTIVTEWDLVCESESLNSVAKFVFMAGTLVGSIVFGYLSDRFGRSLILKWCIFQLAIVDTCVAFARTFPSYCLLRFLAGISTPAIMANCSILIIEWVAPRFQALGMILGVCAFSAGQVLLTGLAYAIRDWRTLQLVVSAPVFVLIFFSRYLTESARWLIINNKPEEGLKELKKAACRNGRKDVGDTLTVEVLKSAMKEEMDLAQTKYFLCDLFSTPTLRMRMISTAFVRFSIIMTYYGLAFHIQHLGSNIFLLHCLFGAVNLPASYVANLTLNHMGRRSTQTLSMFLQGLCLLVIIFIPQEMQILRVVISTLGVGFSFVAVIGSFVHGNELFPTVIRATALGTAGIFSSLGAAVSPLLMILKIYSPLLPWIIYGILSILAGLVILLLPETRNQPLPDTIQDVEKKKKVSRNAKEEDAFIKVTRF
ncbi:solute carrier family 22 member 9 isoform X2 [Tupaia chinensis]|uniref:solute carrier family 22 member 9 isoform X2 n=1 Tax=Tupaia chinensis TaxID=246437 RepID=UPI0003C922BE|nr:solute carrier family 22 member 9 isoform X2 [Tupaia chinensis]